MRGRSWSEFPSPNSPQIWGKYGLDTTSQSNLLMIANSEFEATPEMSTAFSFHPPDARIGKKVWSNAILLALATLLPRIYPPPSTFPRSTPLFYSSYILSQSYSFPVQVRQKSLAPLYAT